MNDYSTDFSTNSNQNFFELQIADEDLLDGKKLILLLESENPDFYIEILKGTSTSKNLAYVSLELSSHYGNIAMVMGDNYFNEKLNFFKESGILRFIVKNSNEDFPNLNYTIKVSIGDSMVIPLGKNFTTKIDQKIDFLPVVMNYDGTKYPKLQKLRFQITSVKQKNNYELTSNLSHKQDSYTMNNIFKKLTGGILISPRLPVCKEKDCQYRVDIKQKGVKVCNIESYLIEEIEEISISHFEELYDRTYDKNEITHYKLKYIKEMEGLDVSVSLIPVTGQSNLYINAKTRPLSLEKFDWKESGNLAKRITIKWEELQEMKAEGSDLYIAVQSSKAGEFSIKIDAHEAGVKGRLSPGITEGGFVEDKELSSYLYIFEVFESQDITFDVRLNIMSGNADLYLKKCKSSNCQLDSSNLLENSIVSVINNQSNKDINKSFTCKKQKKQSPTSCKFIIGVMGKENHGTHFDLSITESQFHRLMLPGKSVSMKMIQDQKIYLKFSYPHKSRKDTLFLSLEHIYGDFSVYLSRTNEFPSEQFNDKKYDFLSSKSCLINSLQVIDVQKQIQKQVVGVYYITIESLSSSKAEIKFFEKSKDQNNVSIHSLTAGQQVKGEINNNDEIIYYTIRISLNDQLNKKSRIILNPLKGSFVLFANKNGELPTRYQNEFFSEDNYLTFPVDATKIQEYIIGVQRADMEKGGEEKQQFMISFSYDRKATQLNPGVLSTFFIREYNLYFIEIHDDMKDLLIIKTIVDGYNINLCASFAKEQDSLGMEKCEYTANEKQVSISVSQKDLKNKCMNMSPCYLHLKLTEGSINEKFQIGYTYNNLPFHLSKGQLFFGPCPYSQNSELNFVYHPSIDEPANIYLNTKGQQLDMYTKLINTEDNEKEIVFPTKETSDYKNEKGFIKQMFYTLDQYKEIGKKPEILITLKNSKVVESEKLFLNNLQVLLQAQTDSTELVRTHAFQDSLEENEWKYYHFYNNGTGKNMRIYVNSHSQDFLEVQVAKGLNKRPPNKGNSIYQESGIQNILIEMTKKKFKDLRGNFVVGVKSKQKTEISIYWNNKTDLNYVEMTAGKEITMQLDSKKKFYFQFFVGEGDKKEDIVVYLRTDVPTKIYLLKSLDNELNAPSAGNFDFSTSTQKMGGLSAIEITPTDENYCTNCSYIGYVEVKQEGTIHLLVDIEHFDVPLELKINSPFPSFLKPHQQRKYKIFNPDTDLMDITISMFGGYIELYIDDNEEVSDQKFKASHSMRKSLDQHKMIIISPVTAFNINTAHDYYLLIKNTGDVQASLMLNVDKNNISSPIFPGITKLARLAPGETKNYFYTPKPNENIFEISFELRNVLDTKFIKQASSLLKDYVDVFNISQFGDRFKLKYKTKKVHENRVYITFDISENKRGKFTIHVYNPVGSGVVIGMNLLNGGYRMMNLNENNVDFLKPSETKLFESYGATGKYLYFDMKICSGDVNVEFFQGEDQSEGKESEKFKTIKDNNSFLHYLKLKSKRAFLKVTNQSDQESAYFEMSGYIERDLQTTPYSEVKLRNNGIVKFDTDNYQVSFQALSINSHYSTGFVHKIKYYVYLTTSMKVMRYVKNCGEFLLDHNYPDEKVVVYDMDLEFMNEEVGNHFGKMQIKLHKLKPNTKFYGVVVAEVKIFGQDQTRMKPLRQNKVFYDEFIFMTPKYHVPFIYLIAMTIIFGGIFMIYFIVKSYIFGKINRMNGLERIQNMTDIDEGSLGYQVMKAMESDLFQEMKKEANQEVDIDIDQKLEDEDNMNTIELTENN